MATKTVQRAAWSLVRRQHFVITRGQLLDLGFTPGEIRHRLADGRLFPLWPGVYAVGRPQLSREGELMAAVLACGDDAALSHASAAEFRRILKHRVPFEVSVPLGRAPRPPGIKVHRRKAFEIERIKAVPVTTPRQTLVDLATVLGAEQHERAVNEAVNLDLVDPEELRTMLESMDPQPGVPRLRRLLDRDTYVLTHTELEQRFPPIARRAGLGSPDSQVYLGRHRVDFFFRELGIVVEANSLRFHRTALQQAKDARRLQTHFAAGLLPIPFTHYQITYEPKYVEETLRALSAKRSLAAP